MPYDRLDSEVTAGKAANGEAEDECWQLQEQDLQLRLQASKASLVAATERLHASRNEASLQGASGFCRLHGTYASSELCSVSSVV